MNILGCSILCWCFLRQRVATLRPIRDGICWRTMLSVYNQVDAVTTPTKTAVYHATACVGGGGMNTAVDQLSLQSYFV